MPELKYYKAFYSFYGIDQHISSSNPIMINEADIYTDLLGKLEGDSDFFGLIDTAGTTFQVAYEEDNDDYWIEIPDPESRGSYGRTVSFDEIVDIFKSLPILFTTSSIPSLEFQAW